MAFQPQPAPCQGSLTVENAMKCRECSEKLEVLRMCSRVKMRCTGCKREYHIHEVASDLDIETEKILEKYTAIIYD